jgi:hypothetical protein
MMGKVLRSHHILLGEAVASCGPVTTSVKFWIECISLDPPQKSRRAQWWLELLSHTCKTKAMPSQVREKP